MKATPPSVSQAEPLRSELPALAVLPIASALLDDELRVLAANLRLVQLVGSNALNIGATSLPDLLVLPEWDDEDGAADSLAARLGSLQAGKSLSHELQVRDAAHEAHSIRTHFLRLDPATDAFPQLPQAAFMMQFEPAAPRLPGRSSTVSQPLAWYRTLFLESVLPKLLLDERFRIVDANDAALEFTGYGLTQLLWADPSSLLANDAARSRLARERSQAEFLDDPIREAMAYPLRLADGTEQLVDAVVARSTVDADRALRVVTLLHRIDEPISEHGAKWRERFLASLRDEQRMLPTLSIGAALVQAGHIVRMTASFAHFFELDPGTQSLPLDRLAGRKTATSIREAALSLDENIRDPYSQLPVIEFIWSSTSGRPSSFVAMARPAGQEDTLLLTVVDTSGRDADIASRLEQLALSRDTLLRQVHHQVSNNLDGLAALVRAEAQWHPHAKDLLERIASRLRVAAHIEGLQPRDYAKSPQPIVELVAGIVRSLENHFETPVHWSVAQALSVPARWIVKNERLALALACNELITNAIKHRADRDAKVQVSIEVLERQVRITVRNPGRLSSPGIDTRDGTPGAAAPQGVALLRRLLPAEGATFLLAQDGADVVGRITLEPPVIY